RVHGFYNQRGDRLIGPFGAHSLTRGAAFVLVRLVTDIGGGAFFTRGIMLQAHFTATVATERDALEQRRPFARRAAAAGAVPVGAQDLLIALKLLPTQIGGKRLVHTDGPLLNWPHPRFGLPGGLRTLKGIIGALAIDIDARIGWIM